MAPLGELRIFKGLSLFLLEEPRVFTFRTEVITNGYVLAARSFTREGMSFVYHDDLDEFHGAVPESL